MVSSFFIIVVIFSLTLSTYAKKGDEALGGGLDLAKVFAMLGGGSNQCKLTCPGGSEPTRNPHHVPTSNGCGSFGIKLDVSEFHGFNECCDVHDKCYDTCHSNRDQCDEAFKECLNDSCHLMGIKHRMPKQKVEACENSASLMHSATVGLGCAAFKDAQRNACLCDGRTLSAEEMKKLEQKKDL